MQSPLKPKPVTTSYDYPGWNYSLDELGFSLQPGRKYAVRVDPSLMPYILPKGFVALDGVCLRVAPGEALGLVGANGEGKSTFLNIISGQLAPDTGNVAWSRRVTAGYLDQHAVLAKGKTIRDVLREAFREMFNLEAEMLAVYDKMGDASPEEMAAMMEDVGEIQDALDDPRPGLSFDEVMVALDAEIGAAERERAADRSRAGHHVPSSAPRQR